ncbi:glycogen debranching protein [Croceivirga thetidis]|uniref:Glycogen debranching protein n=1 Tax=Croceivirga thetidis TaxID=2721623 RepID=A0ABX1GNL6_9FLAO|nr:glycogen debranching protein [Croceivirga thetidis]NKI31517.1 glycogen debranching protein [Croceivirga thetidis]
MRILAFLFFSLLFLCCIDQEPKRLSSVLENTPSIAGKKNYLESPYVTAGDRVYMVGHQDGTFPDMGWHIKGEMGGIWNHPIKLMDGFDVNIYIDGDTLPLNKADEFINYPMANKHVFKFPNKYLVVERWQFVPDGKQGVFVQFLIRNIAAEPLDIKFEFIGHSDLRPTWLGEQTQMIDGKDVSELEGQKWVVKDTGNNWFTIFGTDHNPSKSETIPSSKGNTVSNSLIYELHVEQPQVLNFVIAGSYQSKEEALQEYAEIHSNYHGMAEDKRIRYAALAVQSKLTVPDKDLEQTFEWLKYNCDWLVRTVPEVGTGIGAGIPDYPWWFGVDSEYALKGYMAVGQEATVNKTIKLLDSVSMALNGNGKIIHEMSTNGVVFNPGNINETPQFASLIWEIYQWNGNKEFLKKYFPIIEKGLNWLMQENDANGNLFPDGFGMMEIHGLDSEMIDVAAYTQRAFVDAAKMADELDKTGLANQYEALAANLKAQINRDFWSEDFSSYADFLGTDEQALHLIEDAIVRADTLNKPWAIEELEATRKQILANPSEELKPFVLHHNWVVNTPMEMGIADSTKAITALNTAKKFTNPFGVFVTGIDRDDSAGSNDGAYEAPPIFTYTGAVMTLPTGVQAVAENNYGRPDEALDYLKRMTRSFSYALPGSMYEVSPDFGMMTQAWNIYSFAIPVVQQFFGIQPQAQNETIIIKPQMPLSWNEAALENVKVADNEVSVFYKNINSKLEIEILQTNQNWTIQLELPEGNYSVNGAEFEDFEKMNNSIFRFTGAKVTFTSN